MKTYFFSYTEQNYFFAYYNNNSKKYYWSKWFQDTMYIEDIKLYELVERYDNIPIEIFLNHHNENKQTTVIIEDIQSFPANIDKIKSQYPEYFI